MLMRRVHYGRPSVDPALERLLARFAKTGDRESLARAFGRLRSLTRERIGGRLGTDETDDILQGTLAKFITRAPNLPRSFLTWFNNIVDEEVELALGRRERDRSIRNFERSMRRCAIPRDVESDVFVAEIYAATATLSPAARRVVHALCHEPLRCPSLTERQALAVVVEMLRRRFEPSARPAPPGGAHLAGKAAMGAVPASSTRSSPQSSRPPRPSEASRPCPLRRPDGPHTPQKPQSGSLKQSPG